MNTLLLWLARGAGVVGLLLCAASVASRLTGNYLVGSYQVGTLLLAGIAATAAGCFLFLWVLVARAPAER